MREGVPLGVTGADNMSCQRRVKMKLPRGIAYMRVVSRKLRLPWARKPDSKRGVVYLVLQADLRSVGDLVVSQIFAENEASWGIPGKVWHPFR